MLTQLLKQVLRDAKAAMPAGANLAQSKRFEEAALAAGRDGDLDAAVLAAGHALEQNPRSVVARFCLGNVYYRKDRLDDAIRTYCEALEIQADNASVHYNLALALQTRGDSSDAVAHYRRTVALMPDLAQEHSTLLFLLNADPAADPLAVSREHISWGQRFADPLIRRTPHANPRDPRRRLRIGYVSGDFSGHAASSFIAPLIDHHDRSQFEIIGFANADSLPGEAEFPGVRWHRILGLEDEPVARLIEAEGVDILVDLSGHTTRNRLFVFARKPAPLQMTMLGYPNTTGLAAMDYRITDIYGDPPGLTEHLYRERLLRLPECLWCYRPSPLAPEPVPAPCVSNGHVTFGSLNAAYKLNDGVFEAWAAILGAVPESRLVIATIPKGEAQRRIFDRFASSGIAPDRIEVVERQPVLGYWKLVGRVDLAFDSFPCGGGATICEALWLGVPTLSLAGATFLQRAGLSLLTNLGLEELVAHSVDEYVQAATALGRAPAEIARLRQGLRDRFAASPISDAERYARSVEALYRNAWVEWCERPQC
jgi:predicted O-linked N-acetylglucosamine transferase (SPINDLY family)